MSQRATSSISNRRSFRIIIFATQYIGSAKNPRRQQEEEKSATCQMQHPRQKSHPPGTREESTGRRRVAVMEHRRAGPQERRRHWSCIWPALEQMTITNALTNPAELNQLAHCKPKQFG
jgi:hypothetical protein